MSVFTLTIDSHGTPAQFGSSKESEAAMIRELFAQAAVAIGSLEVATEAAPKALVLNRVDGNGSGVVIPVGSYFFGSDSHAVSEAEARAAEQAAYERQASESAAKPGKAAA